MRDLIRTHPFQAASAVVMMVLLGTTAYLVVTLIDTRSDQSNTAADVRIIKAACELDPEQNGSTNESGGNDATDPSDGPAPGPGPSDPSGGDSGGDPGDGGGGVADDPPATDPPATGGDGGADPEPPGGGGDPPGGPSAPPTADPSPPTLGSGVGEVIDSITGGVCEQTGLSLPAVCP